MSTDYKDEPIALRELVKMGGFRFAMAGLVALAVMTALMGLGQGS